MAEYNLTHTGAELDEAINKVKSGYILPQGTAQITANGTYDIKNYESVGVNVPVPDDYINIANVLNHCTKIAADKISWSSNKSIGEVSIDVGFKPKIFIIRNNSGITINSTGKHIVCSYAVFDESGERLLEPTESTNATVATTNTLYVYSTSIMSQTQNADNNFHQTDTGVSGSGKSVAFYFEKSKDYYWIALG